MTRKTPNLFYLEGAERRRRSGVMGGVRGKCRKCEGAAEFFVSVQFADARYPFTGKLCRKCFGRLSAATQMFEFFDYAAVSLHLSADGAISEATYRKLALRNNAKSTWADHIPIN